MIYRNLLYIYIYIFLLLLWNVTLKSRLVPQKKLPEYLKGSLQGNCNRLPGRIPSRSFKACQNKKKRKNLETTRKESFFLMIMQEGGEGGGEWWQWTAKGFGRIALNMWASDCLELVDKVLEWERIWKNPAGFFGCESAVWRMQRESSALNRKRWKRVIWDETKSLVESRHDLHLISNQRKVKSSTSPFLQ